MKPSGGTTFIGDPHLYGYRADWEAGLGWGRERLVTGVFEAEMPGEFTRISDGPAGPARGRHPA